jgi:murein L,D-transpeptidase YcbB/YkuD
VRVKAQYWTVSAAAALLCGAAPATARRPPAPAPAPAAPVAPVVPPLLTAAIQPSARAVDAFYAARRNAPIWFRNPATLVAASQLPAILDRAPLDGMANGPTLARFVESAVVRGRAAMAAHQPVALADEKLLSSAWAQYVAALRSPVPGITYGDVALAPRVPTADRVLTDAWLAPSLAGHVAAIAAVNPIYGQLRDAAWRELKAGRAADPRLLTNLERARILPSRGRYIIVNAATARLSMYEDGRAVDSMKVVVGKPATPTPMLAGTIHYATFNPYWNIPADTAREEVAPIVLKRGIKYLKLARYEVASDWSDHATVLDPASIDWKAVVAGATEVHLRQLPGPDNMMGQIKFGFANELGIFLHDTPRKELFSEDSRNYSHGCVRVEDAMRLGRWLMGTEPVAPSSDPEQFVQLAKAVLVYITYLTAVPGLDDAQLTFANDVYGRDPKAAGLADLKLATNPPSAAATARP